ncbi:MAG TPA: hypothetical protein VI454_14995, partial [Verrucomicrobiae bacterium]
MSEKQTIETRSGLRLEIERHAQGSEVEIRASAGKPCLLHWGVRHEAEKAWHAPPPSVWPAGTQQSGEAVQTPFAKENGQWTLALRLSPLADWAALEFVLFFPDERRWDNNQGRNYQIPLRNAGFSRQQPPTANSAEVSDQIIRAETTHNSWTLMHRFNLCYDLIEQTGGNLDALAALYAWLRFSAIRQLTWQRNYNTKPKELAHSQDRLTSKLAEVYHAQPAARPLARLMLSTVGRGGEGQRIRDEILNIMHRHHVKEVTGHFLEEWHQKLHNNTTPDDVVICEAYLEFLRSNGNTERFYETLAAGGVTRERLESFERPIRTAPDFVGHIKDGLLGDFQNFLKILKASHSGTDFETAVNAARGQLDGDLQGRLDYLWSHRNDAHVPLTEFVSRITQARSRLSDRLHRGGGLRELLYLDLALEALLRGVVERNIHLRLDADTLANLIACVLENVTLSYEDPELAACSRHWQRLVTSGASFQLAAGSPSFQLGVDWSLHAKSVVDRIARALGNWIDHWYRLLQPKAEYLGRGFQAEEWTVTLFSEEVVRGSSLGFVLSILLRHLEPLLRQAAHIGDWQIVSRAPESVTGKVEAVDSLRAIQHSRFDEPTIILADKVMGDEEIPEGVVAVIAPDVTDIVSHVAVRARNANLLFAACHDAETLERLKSRRGQFLRLGVTPAGDVLIEEATPEISTKKAPVRAALRTIPARRFTRYAVGFDEFDEKLVGGKARHLAQLRGRLPDWIKLPASVAVPFGVFENVLALAQNKAIADKLSAAQDVAATADTLATLREAVLSLTAPKELPEALRQT